MPQPDQVIVFDMDDCLSFSRPQFAAALNAATGKDIPWEDWTESYDLTKTYGLDAKGLLDVWAAANCFQNAVPEDGARDILDFCKSQGFKIVILTARGWHPEAAEITAQWMQDHGLYYDEIIISGYGKTKRDAIAELQARGDRVLIFVDDHLDHLKDVAALVPRIELVLVDRPWNSSKELDSSSHRIFHLDQLLRVIDLV